MFNVVIMTGIITTRRNLDRERVSEYQLTVDARDGGSEACTMEVFVTITDINDNEPVFSQPYYTVSIPENAEINTLITRVSAVDRDLGKYSLWPSGLYIIPRRMFNDEKIYDKNINTCRFFSVMETYQT